MSQKKILVTIDPELEDLIPGFLENRNNDISRLQAAIVARDFDTLRSVGHSLKGVGGGYGFAKITDLGADIEAAASVSDVETIQQLVSELADYLGRVEVRYQ